MTNTKFAPQLVLFIIILFGILGIREYASYQLIENGIDSYSTHTYVSIMANIILIVVSYLFIKKNELLEIAGLKGTKLRKSYLLIFPLAYLVLLNALFMDDINTEHLYPNIAILLVYAISIGISEELSIRGFLQSHLIKRFGNTKRTVALSVFVAALFFGLIHLFNFDKGLFGELSQICFATFIGAMFGFLLVITKRIYPLIIIHTAIDFVAKLDSAGFPIKEKIREAMSIENAVLSTLLAPPCLIYALFLMKRYTLTEQTE